MVRAQFQVIILPPNLVLHHEFCRILGASWCTASQRALNQKLQGIHQGVVGEGGRGGGGKNKTNKQV